LIFARRLRPLRRFLEFGLKSWDTAAGILLVKEAGGTVSDSLAAPTARRPGSPRLNGHIHIEWQEVAADVAERSIL